MESKEAIRKRLLDLRQQLRPSQIQTWSQAICENLDRSALLRGVRSVGLYAPTRGEVETQGIFDLLKTEKVVVSYPRVEGADLRFYVVASSGELEPGRWGIQEPSPASLNPIEIENIDVLLVPGVAFDERGYRIGFGKGFYDRILSRFSQKAVGLAYECQLMKAIPYEATDRPCHWVITEKRVIPGS